MAEGLAWRGIPGRTNLDLARKCLEEHGIPSRREMVGMSFETLPPVSVNNLWVDAAQLEQAVKLINELAKEGWEISVQRFQTEGGDPDDSGESGETG